MAVSNNIKVYLRVNVDRDNINDLPNLSKFLVELFCKASTIKPYLYLLQDGGCSGNDKVIEEAIGIKEIFELEKENPSMKIFFKKYHPAKFINSILENDVPFSIDTMKERLNDELANNYGNLVSRSFKIVEKDFEGIVPSVEIKLETSKELIKDEEKLSLFVKENIESFNIDTAVFEISNFLKKVNKYFGDLEPWKCKKQGETQKEAECLYVTLDALRVASILFSPILIDTSKKVLNALSVPSDERTYNHTLTFGKLKAGSKIEMLSPIFMKY